MKCFAKTSLGNPTHLFFRFFLINALNQTNIYNLFKVDNRNGTKGKKYVHS